MIAVVGALAAFYHEWIEVKNAESRYKAACCWFPNADHRGHVLQVQHRPTFHVSAKFLWFCRELFVYDVCHAVRTA